MNRSFLFTFLLLGSLASAENATTAQQVEARKNALEVAGAFGNAGFKLRDGHWASPIKKGEVKLIQVNLYAGNEYYFSAAFVGPAKKVALSIYDETGAPIAIDEPYEDKAIVMMRGILAALEKHNKVQIVVEAIEAAVRLSHRYIPARHLAD